MQIDVCSIFLPVVESLSILQLMIFPDGANIFSSSISVRDGGSPLMYRLAPFIPSLLGRA